MLAPMIVKTVPPASCTCLACSVVLLPPNSARCGFIQSHRYFGDTDCDRSVLPREGIRLDSSPCATHVRTPTPRIPRRPEPRTCSVTATLPNYRFCFRVRLSHTFGFLAGRWRNKRVVGRFLLQRMGIHRAPGCILSTRGSLQQRSTLHVCALWGGGGVVHVKCVARSECRRLEAAKRNPSQECAFYGQIALPQWRPSSCMHTSPWSDLPCANMRAPESQNCARLARRT